MKAVSFLLMIAAVLGFSYVCRTLAGNPVQNSAMQPVAPAIKISENSGERDTSNSSTTTAHQELNEYGLTRQQVLQGLKPKEHRLETGISLVSVPLPDHVIAPDNQLTLFADFNDHSREGFIILYLVNRTAETVELNDRDGNIFLKQEFKDETGNWTRSQLHENSWCGHSHSTTRYLKPDSYLRFAGVFPEERTPREVRYKRYSSEHPLVSNSAMGFIDPDQVTKAKYDNLALRFGDFEFLKKVALGKHRPPDADGNWLYERAMAIELLRSKDIPKDKLLSILKTISADPDPEVAELAEDYITE